MEQALNDQIDTITPPADVNQPLSSLLPELALWTQELSTRMELHVDPAQCFQPSASLNVNLPATETNIESVV